MRDGQRSRNNQKNAYRTLTPNKKAFMSHFKLKFITTKEICQNFWKSVDKGELSISLFDSNKNDGMGSLARNNSFGF